MPEARRKFVHDLAAVYRMDTQMVDQEPHRRCVTSLISHKAGFDNLVQLLSVQLIRRIDTRVPKPLLSTAAATNNLGRLADFRHSPSPGPRPIASSASVTSAPRGWTSVVAQSNSQPRQPSSAWGISSANAARTTTPAHPASSSSRLVQLNRPVVLAPEKPSVEEHIPDDWENDEI